MNRLATVVAILAAFMTWPAHAATFTYTNIDDSDVRINLKGEIVEGDDANLQKTIEWAETNQHRQFFGLSLNSPGGSVFESIKIATRVAGSTVTVGDGAECVSACFNILAAGKNRSVYLSSHIGVHSIVNAITHDETPDTEAGTVLMARYLTSMNVPANVVGKLVSTPPEDMYYLTEADKRAMFTILGETSTTTPMPTPVFTPPEPEPMPSAPTAPETESERCFRIWSKTSGGLTEKQLQDRCDPTPAPAPQPTVSVPAPQPVVPQTYRVTITDQRGNNLIYDFATGSSPDILVETAYTKNGQTFISSGATWEYRPGQSGGRDLVQMSDSRWWLNCNLSVATLVHNGNVVGNGYCGSPGTTFTGNSALPPPAPQPTALAPYDADCFVEIGGYIHLNGHCTFQPYSGVKDFTVIDNDGRKVFLTVDPNGHAHGLFKGLQNSHLRLEREPSQHFHDALSSAALDETKPPRRAELSFCLKHSKCRLPDARTAISD
jgi:hypothetical protein